MVAGSAAKGCVSIAVTKIELGAVPGVGTLLNGRVCKADHKPESNNAS